MQKAIEYFTVFGGLEIKIDVSKPLEELIKTFLLDRYSILRKEINSLTGGYSVDHAVLSGIALGNRNMQTAFKKAHVSFEEGSKCVENLVEKEIIEIESSCHFALNQRGENKTNKKLLFTAPFLRFWFAFISPIYKGIKEGNYEEFYTLYNNRKAEFSDFIFEELALEFLIDFFEDDKIKVSGKYWNETTTIDLVAKTKSGKIVVGNCKYSDKKIKKSELIKLQEDCKNIDVTPDIFVFFAKNGYTNEFKTLKSENLKLFNVKSLKLLLK